MTNTRSARTIAASGLLAAACVVWAAVPLSGARSIGPVVLAAAVACAALSVARLALGAAPGDPVVYLNPVVHAWRLLTRIVRRWLWAEGLVVAALVLEALHRSRPWHTGLLSAALLAYLLAVHLAESRARRAEHRHDRLRRRPDGDPRGAGRGSRGRPGPPAAVTGSGGLPALSLIHI